LSTIVSIKRNQKNFSERKRKLMKILFINPPDENKVSESPDEQGDEYIESDDFGHFPPLGLLYVLSYLEANTKNHEIVFKDCVAEQISHQDLKEVIKSVQPDVLAITSFTVSLVDVVLAARSCRELCPSCHICMGGHHPIAFPFEAAQLPEFDSIVVGEGEIVFTDLVNSLEAGEDITNIEGVYTNESVKKYIGVTIKKDKRFLQKVQLPPAYVDDIDELPIPNRKYISHINYKSVIGVSKKLATMISSRGCPYKCTFCDIPLKSYKKRDPASVVDEMQVCLDMGYDEIHFYDDLFNITPKRLIDICDEIDKRNIKVKWDFRGRVNGIDYESLVRFKKSGGRMISFGVETASDEGLKILRKGSKVKQNIQALAWCKELGIVSVADYMIGLPHEKNEKDVWDGINILIKKYKPDFAQFGVLSLYPNTEIYDQAVDKGLIDGNKWNKWVVDPVNNSLVVDHWNEYISTIDLVRIQKSAYKKFYFRPSIIFKELLRLRSFHQFKTKFIGAIKVLGVKKLSNERHRNN